MFDSITDVVEKRLKLKVNREKSSVLPAAKATLLGFGFYIRDGVVKIRVDPKAVKRLTMRLRDLTRRNWGVSMDYRIGKLSGFIVGWMGYFRLTDASYVFRDLDSWLRRRLRQIRWKEWKRPRTRFRNLRALGIPFQTARQWAGSSKGYWRVAGSALSRALPNTYWDHLGLPRLIQTWQRFKQPA